MRLNPSTAAILGMLIAAVFLNACRDPDNVGREMLSAADVQMLDTFAVHPTTFRVDKVVTDELYSPDYNLLGAYRDPQFGLIEAAFYAKYLTLGSSVTFDSTAQIDSVKLYLFLAEAVGDFRTPFNLDVREITQDWVLADTMYSSQQLTVADLNLAAGRVLLPVDAGAAFAPQTVGIPLDTTIGGKILRAPSDALTTPTSFGAFFRGLRVSVAPNGTGAGYVVAPFKTDTPARLRLFYHVDTTARQQDFEVTAESPSYHSIIRSEYDQTLLGQIGAGQPSEYVLVQNNALVTAPGTLGSLNDVRIKPINRAELTYFVDPALNPDQALLPLKLFLLEASADDANTPDYSRAIVAANFDSTTQSYAFVVTNYVRELITGRTDRTYILSPQQSYPITSYNLRRVVLGSATHPTLKPRLRVFFSELP